MSGGAGFFAELRRRHVWRIVVAYVVTAWLLLQLASIVLPAFGTPGWVLKALIVVLVILFPIALILAWAFEITPEGVRRTVPLDSDQARDAGVTRAIGRKLNTGIIVALVLAVALLLVNTRVWHKGMGSVRVATDAPASTATAIRVKSVAVLPFENLSADEKNAYFASGIQNLILTRLADIGDLKVISRTSTMQYQSHPANLRQVAEELGVATILEGSVQKAGNQVLVSVQLVDAATDTHIWAETYRRTLDDIFTVEGEVAGNIATALHAELSPRQAAGLAKAPTTDKAAYDAFLRAEYHVDRNDVTLGYADLKTAIKLYRQAVTEDPAFALAFARLSMAESLLAFGSAPGEEGAAQLTRRAQADAEQALKLQPDLPAAHLALGYNAYRGHRDYDQALKAFDTALALRPNDAEALAAQGYVQRRQGHFDAAIASLTQAAALDPRNYSVTVNLAETYMSVSRYAEAEDRWRRALALKPDSILAKGSYAQTIVLGAGDVPRALSLLQDEDPALKGARASLLNLQRKFPQAIALIQSIPDTSGNFSPGFSRTFQLATLHLRAGDTAQAKRLFTQSLPRDMATLGRSHGLHAAHMWMVVAFDQIGSGHTAKGMAAIRKSLAIQAKVPDALIGPRFGVFGASAYSWAGRADLAVPLLAKTLATPGGGGFYSPVMLWLDPDWDPIRQHPRFQALLAQYAEYQPAVTYLPAPAAAASTH